MKSTNKKFFKSWQALLGLGIVSFYLTTALNLIDYPQRLFVILIFAISPVAIFGVLSVAKSLSVHSDSISLQLAKVFGFIAFAIFEAVMCVQAGTRVYYREKLLTSTEDESIKQIAQLIFKGVNSVQFTMDVAFDIFYCLMIILFSFLMIRNKNFGKAVGGLGIFSGLGLLLLNLWTFPYPPAESGLVDFGPLTGAWWIWVIILLFRNESVTRKV